MRILFVLISFVLAGSIFFFPRPVFADYQQAYQDYLVQYDVYRKSYSDFQIAKNEYEKFKTLTSQTTALEKTKVMMAMRDQLLRMYLFMLQEKVIGENSGLSDSTKSQYQGQIVNEVTFLDNHISRISSIGSLEDAQEVSKELESHYAVLQITIHQILIGLSLGQLAIASNHYDELLRSAQTLVTTHDATFTPQKRETINRWLIQINNKRGFYQQKIDSITQLSAQLSPRKADRLEESYNDMVRGIAEARQYLVEGVSFVGEVRNGLKYVE